MCFGLVFSVLNGVRLQNWAHYDPCIRQGKGKMYHLLDCARFLLRHRAAGVGTRPPPPYSDPDLLTPRRPSYHTRIIPHRCLVYFLLPLQEFVKIARLRLQMSRIGVPPNAEMQARAEGKDPSAVAEEVRCVDVCARSSTRSRREARRPSEQRSGHGGLELAGCRRADVQLMSQPYSSANTQGLSSSHARYGLRGRPLLTMFAVAFFPRPRR